MKLVNGLGTMDITYDLYIKSSCYIYNLADTAFIGMLKSTEALSAIFIAVTNIVVAQYGDNVVAAFGVVLKIISLGQLIVLGYVQGFQPIASYSYGAKNMPRFFDAIKVVLCICIAFTIVYIAFANPILKIFTTDLKVLAVARPILISQVILYIPWVLLF